MDGLRRGTVSVPVEKTQFSEAFPGAIIREGADELMFRAEEVGMQRTFIDTKHIELERWGPPLVDADRHALCQVVYKGTEGDECEELYYHCRELSQAARAKKPSESQKVKALWTMKAARRRNEEFYDPARVWNCVKNISKIRWRLWRRRWSAWKLPANVGIWFHRLSLSSFVFAMAFSIAGAKFLRKMWEGPYWEEVWPFLDPWDVVGLRTTFSVWNVLGKYGPHGELFFFLIKKEPFALTEAMECRPFVRAETLKACALIDLHLVEAESTSMSSGSQSPDLGDAWRNGCPRSPEWDSDVDVWTQGECTPRCDVYDHNNECRALEVIGQDWSSEVVAPFLDDWEFARVALSCPMALDIPCQEMDACQDRSESQGSQCSLCSQCLEDFSQKSGEW